MFCRYLGNCALKGRLSTEPFIDHHSQGILVAGRMRMALYLLWRHVKNGANHLLLRTLGRYTTADYCRKTKVAEQNLILFPDEHVLWLDVAMDESFVVGIL